MTEPADSSPPLDEAAVERYARQIVVPGVGGSGQARLCAATAAVVGDLDGASAARAYLQAAGLSVLQAPFAKPVDCVVIADARQGAPSIDMPPCRPDAMVAWYTLAGTTLVGGLTTARDFVIDGGMARDTARSDAPLDIALHRIGGADAAGTAIEALLGWIDSGEHHQIAMPPLLCPAREISGPVVRET